MDRPHEGVVLPVDSAQSQSGSATAILAHKTSNGKTKDRQRLAPVTEQHYSRSQRIDLKAEGMALKALLAAYAKESRKFRDLRADRIAT